MEQCINGMTIRSGSNEPLLISGIVVYFIDRFAEGIAFVAADEFQQGGDVLGAHPGGEVRSRHALAVDRGIDRGRSDAGGHSSLSLRRGVREIVQVKKKGFCKR